MIAINLFLLVTIARKRHLFVEYSVTNQRFHWILHTHFSSSLDKGHEFFYLAHLKQCVTIIELPLKRVNGAFMFLVADTQLYKRLCPSVGPSVRRSVGWSVMVIK